MRIKIVSAVLTLTLSVVLFFAWYVFVSLKEVPLAQTVILDSYEYSAVDTPAFELEEIGPNSFKIAFKSFDGAKVNGQITFPPSCAKKCPVLIGVSAMGRNYHRWWLDSWKDRPTVTSVNKIGRAALESGYALVAIDARYHGTRKDPEKPLRSIMNDLHFFGDKSSYEQMIVNTVKDYRVLIDWLSKNSKIDSHNIVMAGYSMGAQISLLTASVDNRINRVVSIVPPYIDDKVAVAAPKNVVSLISATDILFISSSDDENASKEKNQFLFNLLPAKNKEHIVFEGNHILPPEYVDSVKHWLIASVKSTM